MVREWGRLRRGWGNWRNLIRKEGGLGSEGGMVSETRAGRVVLSFLLFFFAVVVRFSGTRFLVRSDMLVI